MTPFLKLEQYISRAKEILQLEGVSTELLHGTLYKCGKNPRSTTVMLINGGEEIGKKMDHTIIREQNVAYSCYWCMEGRACPMCPMISFNKKNIINGEISPDTKIVIGDIDEEDIDGMKVFKLKKMKLYSDCDECRHPWLSSGFKTFCTMSPSSLKQVPLENKFMVVYCNFIKMQFKRSAQRQAVVSYKCDMIIDASVNDFLFRNKYVSQLTTEDDKDELAFLNGIRNCGFDKFTQKTDVSKYKLLRLSTLIEDLFYEWNPSSTSMMMKMTREKDFVECLETYIEFNKSSLEHVPDSPHEKFYQFVCEKFGDKLKDNIEVICNVVNGIIGGFRKQLAKSYINAIKQAVFTVKTHKFTYEYFKYIYYKDTYDKLKKEGDNRINTLECGCNRYIVGVDDIQFHVKHKIGDHKEEDRGVQYPKNYLYLKDYPQHHAPNPWTAPAPTDDVLEKYPPGTNQLENDLSIRSSFWTNFVSYYYNYCHDNVNQISINMINHLNGYLYSSTDVSSVMAPRLEQRMNFDMKNVIYSMMRGEYEKEIYAL